MDAHDVHRLPLPVSVALLELTKAVLETCAPPSAPPARLAEPASVACLHATADRPCCPACAALHSAEAVLAEVQEGQTPTMFPRSEIEQAVLEVLQLFAPVATTPRQVADVVERPREEVRLMLQALVMLGTSEHPGKGYYRHKPVGEDRSTAR